MSDRQRRNLIERIRKLVALGEHESTNEHVALGALKRAHAMLAEHNLTMEMLGGGPDEMQVEVHLMKDAAPWRRAIGSMICQMYFCVYFNAQTTDGAYHHYVSGEKHNVAIARMMLTYMCDTIEHLADEGVKQAWGTARGYRETFLDVCTMRVCARIQERIDEARRGQAQDCHGYNLPVLATEYDRKLAATTKFLDERLNFSQRATIEHLESTLTSAQALRDGHIAGDRIGLDPQVGGNGSVH